MIIECPKCKTRFEVEDSALKSGDIKFQCADCAFVWVEHIRKLSRVEESKPVIPQFKEEKLPSCLVEEGDNTLPVEKNKFLKLFSVKNLTIVLLLALLIYVVSFVAQSVVNMNTESRGKSFFDVKNEKNNKLYIELAKPLTLVKEGVNEYVIIRGFIYNPTENVIDVPKLVIRLRNKDNRVLQEQEREVETKTLMPLEKTDFMFKVFKFSSQVASVEVDFIETDKI